MKLTTKIIADKVIEFTGVDIRKSRRNPNMVINRAIYCKLCSKLLNTNLTNIGKEIGKHHATVIHYQKIISNPNYFKLDCQTRYLDILNDLIKEYDLKVLEEPKHNQQLLNEIVNKDKSYTKLLLKYDKLKIELEDIKNTNTKLVENNLKLKLGFK